VDRSATRDIVTRAGFGKRVNVIAVKLYGRLVAGKERKRTAALMR
jgi:hypothetical protein